MIEWGTLSLLELVWCIVNAVCLLLQGWMLVDVHLDDRFLVQQHVDGAARLTTRQKILEERARFFTSSLYLLIGILAALTPPPLRPQNQLTSLVTGALLLFMVVANMSVSIMSRLIRKQILAILIAEEQAKRLRGFIAHGHNHPE